MDEVQVLGKPRTAAEVAQLGGQQRDDRQRIGPRLPGDHPDVAEPGTGRMNDGPPAPRAGRGR